MKELILHSEDRASGSLFIKDVDLIDCCLFSPYQGVIGQSWHVDIAVSGHLDQNGFVYDFSDLKRLVKQVLKSSMDHALLLPIMSSQVQYAETDTGELWKLKAKARLTNLDSDWEYLCPKGAVFPIRAISITKESIEQECTRLLRHRLPQDIHKVEIRLREESSDPTAAFFRYSHGITNHGGMCQRLFHGHRSLIEVHVNDERRPDLEHYIAREVFDSSIHIACPSQVVSGPVEIGRRGTSDAPVHLAYSGSFGRYEVRVPANKVFLVEGETSIESITQQLVRVLAAREKNSRIKVTCYEGIGKGGIAEGP